MRKTRQNKKTSSKRRQTKKYMKYGGEDIANEVISEENAGYCIFKTKNITTEQNTSKKKEEKIGVIHFTDSGSINAVRQTFTGVANIFGRKGFDNIIYDKIRNEALRKLDELLERKQHKLYNMRMEFGNNYDTILIHIYGSLYQKKGASVSEEETSQEVVSEPVAEEAETEAEAEAEAEGQPEAEAEGQPEAEAEAEAEGQPEAEAEPEPEGEAEAEGQPEAEPEEQPQENALEKEVKK